MDIINLIDIIVIIFVLLVIYIARSIERKNIQKRSELERHLHIFMNQGKIKNRLINANCEIRLINIGSLTQNNNLVLFCKEHPLPGRLGRKFTLSDTREHVATIWAMFNMEFNNATNINSLKKLYALLNPRYKYLLIENSKTYENLLPENMAENEYCRMELVQQKLNEFVLIVYDIWDCSEEPRNFIIKGSYDYLNRILTEFKLKKNKFRMFCEIKNDYQLQNDNEVIIRPIEENNPAKIKKDNIIDPQSEIIELDIQKYNERKLDL